MILGTFGGSAVSFEETRSNYDFVATVANYTDMPVKITAGENEGLEPLIIQAHDWIGLLANSTEKLMAELIKSGDFSIEEAD